MMEQNQAQEDKSVEKEEIADKNCGTETTVEPASEETQNQEEETKVDTAEIEAMWRDKLLRLQAEYDNYRKRSIKEKAELIKTAGENILCGLLPVVDDFERALDAMKKTQPEAVEGVELIYNKFVQFLKKERVEVIPTDAKFDETVHEAIAMMPSQDGQEKGDIVDCTQKGYKLGDKVIRHAKVVVAG